MTTTHELRKHFAAILGGDAARLPDEVVAFRETVALYSFESGLGVSMDIGVTGSSSKRCDATLLLTIVGLSFVGAEGKAEVRLSEFQCGRALYRSPFVIAMVRTDAPVFVTAVPAIVDNEADVLITFHTWAAGGAPAPNVLVTWLCRVQSQAQAS